MAINNLSPERRSRILSRAKVLKQPGKAAPAAQPQPQSAPTLQQQQKAAAQESAKRSFTGAFTALKQTRLFRNLKKGGLRNPFATGLVGLFEDHLETDLDQDQARSYLKGEVQEDEYRQAKREALMLQHLEKLGGHPTHLVRYLLSLLGTNRDRDFKHFIVDQLKPRLDALAAKVPELSVRERRLVAALIARASYQVGVRSAENFSKLLTAAGAAEAAHWAKAPDKPAARAQQLVQSLRRAASPVYRTALIQAGREGLKKLSGETVGLVPDELHLTWAWLLRAAECLESEALTTLAEALVAGFFSKGGPGAVGRLTEGLDRVLHQAPGGAGLVVQLIVALTAKGEVKAARQLGEVLLGVFNHARTSCVPVLNALREQDAQRAPEASKEGLYRQLEVRGALLVGLLPACSRTLERGQGLPEGSAELITESLLCLATLGSVGATASGQRLLHRELLAQERGRETFLVTLPRVAMTLSQPSLIQTLWEAGLTTTHYKYAGRPFLERVALHTGRALVNPLMARTRKGDVATAKALLRSMIRSNAALFGLSADGALLAAEALEAQRDKPDMVPLKKTLYRLAKIRKKNATGQHPDSLEPFQDLVTALAEGGLPRQAPRTGTRRTVLELSVDNSAQAKSTRKPTHLELHVDQLERNRR
ncbi:MAG TPA: hypothetical protein VF815_27945 [Myxococcaceae bacterium]|jgi:hypothetical protein